MNLTGFSFTAIVVLVAVALSLLFVWLWRRFGSAEARRSAPVWSAIGGVLFLSAMALQFFDVPRPWAGFVFLGVQSAALSLAVGLTVRSKFVWLVALGTVEAAAVLAWYTDSVSLSVSLVVCIAATIAPAYWLVRRQRYERIASV
jgi:hypothetical protein